MVSATRSDSPAEGPMSEHILHTHGIRKSQKPQMERKRRQRINQCLGELKSLVLEATKKEPSRYSKLEKADVLEMTVKHLRSIYRPDASGRKTIFSDEMAKYRAGYAHCASEVSRCLTSIPSVPQDLYSKVARHLNAVTISGRLGLGNSPNITGLQSLNKESSDRKLLPCQAAKQATNSHISSTSGLMQSSSSIFDGTRSAVGGEVISCTAPSYNYFPLKPLMTETRKVEASKNESVLFHTPIVSPIVTHSRAGVVCDNSYFTPVPTSISTPHTKYAEQSSNISVPKTMIQEHSPTLQSSNALPSYLVTSPTYQTNVSTASVCSYKDNSYFSKNTNNYLGTIRNSSDDRAYKNNSEVTVTIPVHYNISPSSENLGSGDRNLNIKQSISAITSYPVTSTFIPRIQTSSWTMPGTTEQSRHSSGNDLHSPLNLTHPSRYTLSKSPNNVHSNDISNVESYRIPQEFSTHKYQEKIGFTSKKIVQKELLWRPW